MKIDIQEYHNKIEQLKEGNISRELFLDYTKNILYKMLEDNKDVFKRLKERL